MQRSSGPGIDRSLYTHRQRIRRDTAPRHTNTNKKTRNDTLHAHTKAQHGWFTRVAASISWPFCHNWKYINTLASHRSVPSGCLFNKGTWEPGAAVQLPAESGSQIQKSRHVDMSDWAVKQLAEPFLDRKGNPLKEKLVPNLEKFLASSAWRVLRKPHHVDGPLTCVSKYWILQHLPILAGHIHRRCAKRI